MNNQFDCIVIGGGHAGIEASHAAAKLGARTLLITITRDSIGKMSCNPAIGGLGKGQLTREIDALGGLMARAIDATGIQFRLLNRSKGPAVQSPRAQADKYQYKNFVRQELECTRNLSIVQAIASEIVVKDNQVYAVRCLDGQEYKAPTAVLTAGTFLRGIMHIGQDQIEGGRRGEPASNELSDSLKKLGLTVERLKTGTPVRIDAKTVDFSQTERQDGDVDPMPFSFMTDRIDREQVPCWITYTNEKVHKLLMDNLERAPLYSGQINSTGPRYCPSIETKIMRFQDKEKHQIFLEPEDCSQATIYPNGISTSVPKDVQKRMLELIPGTQNARIIHYAYAIEYDYCPATQLKINLESSKISGLFMAGQVNGTSGYEEAAAQGIIAGINAVLKLKNKDPLVLRRDQAYIGVLVDDLLTKEIVEPYRMFTSRAEYRLMLRTDNADRRLTEIGRELGIVDDSRWNRYSEKLEQINRISTYLQNTRMIGASLWDGMKKPGHPLYDDILNDPFIASLNPRKDVIEAVTIEAKYDGYLQKQEKMINSFRSLENAKLPESIDYSQIPHLRAEARERLSAVKPYTIGQAGRIGGITPADLTVLQIYLKKRKGA